MSQETATITTHPDGVFQCFICHYNSYDGPTQGPPAASAQQDVVLLPLLMPWDTRGVVGLTTVPQQLPQSQMPFQAYANYDVGPLEVSFLFRVEPPTNLSMYVGVCYSVCILLLGSNVNAIFTYGGSTIGVCITTDLWSIPMAGICTLWRWFKVHASNALDGCSLYCRK